jgi:hypothetical protein
MLDPGPGSLTTEFAFVLPRGLVDSTGRLHKDGVMRLALAIDELEVQADPRAQANPAYISVLLLERTLVRLGELPAITATTVEHLFASDLAYLQDLYRRINEDVPGVIALTCPACGCGLTTDGVGEAMVPAFASAGLD